MWLRCWDEQTLLDVVGGAVIAGRGPGHGPVPIPLPACLWVLPCAVLLSQRIPGAYAHALRCGQPHSCHKCPLLGRAVHSHRAIDPAALWLLSRCCQSPSPSAGTARYPPPLPSPELCPLSPPAWLLGVTPPWQERLSPGFAGFGSYGDTSLDLSGGQIPPQGCCEVVLRGSPAVLTWGVGWLPAVTAGLEMEWE